ncbi:hypothetical protein WA026_012296 [Henosepilachna vigintioctopunctata]|uniref:ZN622/Rei1/Reh1 zinc finger C2H2-type domain-containing protein n=1 Tax=Henosepilachna vigintioctopunctata TaxID=420089 RepID=A0AAW1UXH6_9CUCU
MSTTNTKPGFSTCITCRLGFKDAELQRLHYKTEWHCYNSKRKVANLPPVSLNDYQQKMSKEKTEKEETQNDKGVCEPCQKLDYQQKMSKEKSEKEETQKDKGVCEPCQKLSANVNACDNHLNSKKYKYNYEIYLGQGDDIEIKSKKENMVNSAQVGNEDLIEKVDSDECDDDRGNPIDNDECLFCSHQSKNFFKNLEHMTEVHSFFIPDIEFCTDVQGLLRYLGEKVTKGYICMWCNESGRDFRSAEAAKSHKVDKGNGRMLQEGVTLAECVDYFDYSSSYPNVKDKMDVDEEHDAPPSGLAIRSNKLISRNIHEITKCR